jgi:uncharacterized protein YacL
VRRRDGFSPSAALVRLLGAAALGLVGALAAQGMIARGWLSGPTNVLYLSLVGVLTGWLVAAVPARWAERRMQRLVERLADVPPDAIAAGFVGALAGLLLTVLLDNVLARVPGFTWYWSLLLASLLMASSIAFFVANRQLLPFPRGPARELGDRHGRAKLLDTSAIIDGRLVDVAEASFLDGHLLVPSFVLGELQAIADDSDALRRRRGRRGLDVLERLSELRGARIEIVDEDVPGVSAVDDKLVRLARARGADLVTTDYNLQQVAQLQGVRVLNLNRLANAVKATHLSGETLSLAVVRPGKEPGQGLAYLDDGTMVVIEGAADRIGETLGVVVTSTLQTNVGRMIFGRAVDAVDDDWADPVDHAGRA